MNMSCTSISIALCTYNGERFLQEQLDSLAAQTRLPDEVVVGDDGSTDRTLEILEQWVEKVPFPVRIQRNRKNLGFVKNFEETLKRCSGEIVFLCDQDDIWLPNKIQKMTEVFEKSPEVGLVYCYAACIDENGNDLRFPRARMSRLELICSSAIYTSPDIRVHDNPPGCCGAVRRDLMQFVFPFPEGLWHDNSLYNMIPFLGETVTLKENLMQYRVHSGSASNENSWEWKFEQHKKQAQNSYKWLLNVYWILHERIDYLLAWSENLPDSKYKARRRKYIAGSQRHYLNRLRVQKNFIVFCPLFFWEVCNGRYFARLQPVQSILYDAGCGIWHSLNPVATVQLLGSLLVKLGKKLLCH